MNRRTFTYAPKPQGKHWIIESPDGGGVVLARKPRGPAILDPVPARIFATEQAALVYMAQRGMARASAAPVTRWDGAAHRAAELDLLSAVSVATHKASTEPAPVRQRTEGSDEFTKRWRAYVKRCGVATFRTVFGQARVIKSRERLERFARDVQRCGGYRPGKPQAIGRDRESWQAFQPATYRDTAKLGRYSDDALSALLAERKAHALEHMRGRWRGADCSPSMRLSIAWDIEVVQREMVRRGLLDATDHDKVNAEPVFTEVDACDALAATGPATSGKPRAVKTPPPPQPSPARATQDAVEFVEAIETNDGQLFMAVFDDDLVFLGLYAGFESRIRTPQDLRAALAAPAGGAIAGWPPGCENPQAAYDRITEHRWDYNVIGRWSRDEGLDLTELKLSRLLGRGPRASLGLRPAA